MRLLHGLILPFVLLQASPLFGQTIDNEGNEFLCTFLPNAITSVQHQVELHLTGRTATTVTIEYPSDNPTTTLTVPVAPGAIEIVPLPRDAAQAWVPDVVSSNAVRISAPEEITAYMVNRFPLSSDAALALPNDALNRTYVLADYEPTSPLGLSVFNVVALFDSTTVTITPASDLAGGRAAGVPFQVTLDEGEAYHGEAVTTGALGTITGTVIESDRVVGVTNGAKATNIPMGQNFADQIFEVAQPVQTWGASYLATNLPNRPGGSIYRVLGAEPGTTVLLDGVAQGTVDLGEFLEIGPLAGDAVIESMGGEPMFVVQYMTSRTSPGASLGDPAMGNVVPPAQFKEDYTFSTVGGSQFAEHFLTIVASAADTATLELDGMPVGASMFLPIGTSGFSVARLTIPEGTHTTASTGGHGITVQGYNLDDSYLYPGGARFEFINPMGDENAPLCDLTLSPGLVAGVARDDRPSEDVNGNGVLDVGEDLNGNGRIDEDTGVFFVALEAGATNLDLTVTPFQPGAPTVSFEVRAVNGTADASGSVRITDGAGNVTLCPVDIGGNLGTSVCQPVVNSTGQPALTTVAGSLDVSSNNLMLSTRNLPAGAIGYYVNSRSAGFVANPGGSFGNLCIADAAMGRHDAQSGAASGAGQYSLTVHLGALPMEPGGPQVAVAGQTWYWQLWYRDTVGGMQTSNFCDAVSVSLR
ncbi:MAG: IgGFc-binding protein [Planctomycetota bacterium]